MQNTENIEINESEKRVIEEKCRKFALKVAIIGNTILFSSVIVVFRMLEFEWKEIFLTLALLIIVESVTYSGVLKAFRGFLLLSDAN